MERLHPTGATLREIVTHRISQLGIRPDENLGQHFLVDQDSIDTLTDSIIPGATVIEIGAGIGQLTEALAKKADRVVSIEIDRRYEPILTQITRAYPNVQIIYDDVLSLELSALATEPRGTAKQQPQIIASLPYHITESFLHKIADFSMHSATLVVSKRLMYAIEAREEIPTFGQLTLLAQTFFKIDILRTIKKQQFFPTPRTDSAIIRFTPKTEREIRSGRRDFLLRRLFLTARYSPLTKNSLKEGLIEFAQFGGRTMTQNQARTIISDIDIPDGVLNKPFQQLSNENLKVLSRALR